MGKESQTEGENWQDLSWTSPVIISRRPGETALNRVICHWDGQYLAYSQFPAL